MAKPQKLDLSTADRSELEAWLRSSTTRRSWAERGRVVLLSSESLSTATTGERLVCSRQTVYNWREVAQLVQDQQLRLAQLLELALEAVLLADLNQTV